MRAFAKKFDPRSTRVLSSLRLFFLMASICVFSFKLHGSPDNQIWIFGITKEKLEC